MNDTIRHDKDGGFTVIPFKECVRINSDDSNRWTPFIGNEKKYKRIFTGMIEIKFDTMETCDYEDDWPIAIMTHFREKI